MPVSTPMVRAPSGVFTVSTIANLPREVWPATISEPSRQLANASSPRILVASTPTPIGRSDKTGAGFGACHPVTFSAPAGDLQAGIGPRFALNAPAGRQIGEPLAVEGD